MPASSTPADPAPSAESPGQGAVSPERPSAARRDGWWFVVIVAVTLLPLAVTLCSLTGERWYPVGDRAIEMLRVGEVGSARTPLVGPFSRFGWDHPGPLLFYVLAPFRLLGVTSVLWGVGAINAGAIVGTLVLARRRGGLPLATITSAVVLLLVRGLGTDLLVDVWNPWVAVLPFLAFVYLAWSLAERDVAVIPWLVGVASFLTQTHVGYVPLAGGITALAVLVAWWSARREPRPVRLRRPLVAAAIVGAVCWAAPVADQLFDSGNLVDVVAYARDPDEPGRGWEVAYGMFGTELGFRFPWAGGDDTDSLGLVAGGWTGPAWVLVGAVAAAGWFAARRGAGSAGRFAIIVLGAVACGVLAASRVTGFTAPYVVRWWWVVAGSCWCALAWSLWNLAHRTRVARVLLALTGCGAVVLSIALAVGAVPARVPDATLAGQVPVLTAAVVPVLETGTEYSLAWVDTRHLGAVPVGLLYELDRRGYDVRVGGEFPDEIGEQFRADGRPGGGTIFVAGQDAIDDGWVPPEGAIRIAAADALTPEDRARLEELDLAIREVTGLDAISGPETYDAESGRKRLVDRGADPQMVREVAELRAAGSGHTLYFVPATST